MGGYGSGTRGTYSAKTPVEDCLTFRMCSFIRDGIPLVRFQSGSTTWTNGWDNKSSISWTFYPNEPEFKLSYIRNKEDSIKQTVRLEQTFPYFGGSRYWFTCSLSKNGIPCNRRVANLYLPPGYKYFGCRHCYELTYQSCQDSGKYDHLLAQVGLSKGLSLKAVKRILKKKETSDAGELMDEMLYL